MPRIASHLRRHGGVAALLGLCLACGDIQPQPGPETPTDEGQSPAKLRHTVAPDGTVTTLADATLDSAWLALDLDTRLEADFAVQSSWDVAFQRYHIRSRGGVNGTGGVTIALLEEPFESITRAPSTGFRADLPDGEDTNDEPDNVFENPDAWYSYDVSKHTLTPRAWTYVIHSDAGQYFKLELLNYYDSVGTPAMLSFRWKQVEPPVKTLTPQGETP